MKEVQKLYAYVDESGQDTKGAIFVVGVVVLENERENVVRELERIEKLSGKGNTKWHRSRPGFRRTYLEEIGKSSLFKETIFFQVFRNSKQYLEMTAYTTAKAILAKAGERAYTASVYVDGLNKKETFEFRKELKALHIKSRKVKGVRRDENNELIRCADSLCGLVRDVLDGDEWAIEMLHRLQKKKAVTAL